jgi:hypothetical protein
MTDTRVGTDAFQRHTVFEMVCQSTNLSELEIQASGKHIGQPIPNSSCRAPTHHHNASSGQLLAEFCTISKYHMVTGRSCGASASEACDCLTLHEHYQHAEPLFLQSSACLHAPFFCIHEQLNARVIQPVKLSHRRG